MKIATRIGTGYGILIALIFAALLYQVLLVHRLQSINSNLSAINFRAAIISLQLRRDLDQVEEFTRKLFATGGDPGYASQLAEMRQAFTENVREVESLSLSAAEKEEVRLLAELWARFAEQTARSPAPGQADETLANGIVLLAQIRFQTERLIRATRLAIESQVEQAARASQRVQIISLSASLAALGVSLLVSFWIVRSIARPLGRLTEGTRVVAQGKFSYRLEEEGRDELAQLSSDFNSMTRRLSELDEMKKDLVSNVSHDLKTPLASLQETHRLLLEGIPGPLNESQRRLLELNLQSAERLSSLIGNLLDLSRIEAGVMSYEMQRQDLAALARTALAELEVPAREKGLRLETELPSEPLPVACDGDRILQVLGNLLGNALKFSPRGSAIRMGLCFLPQWPANLPESWRDNVAGTDRGVSFALLSVADSGPGIAPIERERIFEKFHQVRRDKTTARQGTGLGLAIARSIVEAHRGAIWVEDNPGGGSVFYVLLASATTSQKSNSPITSPV
ncbi:MAG: HAMP domain-containing histidine kinase [Acidobacteria bacterium]|nr:HAMP domain-containing histidine kinase [Acidobacteriota bacterium]